VRGKKMAKWIETDKLILRPFRLNDWKNIFKYTSNPGVWKYVPEKPHTESETRQLVAQNVEMQMERNGFGDHIPIVLKPDHIIIGHIVFRYFYAPYRTMEIGLMIDPDYQGKGYGYEAAEAIIGYGFEYLNLHRIVGSCDTRNTAAWKIMKKLGMREEGHLRKAVIIEEEWRDQYFYGILEEDWEQIEKNE
jgi:[ribosomal protein S5]-alanine N-acetyltransferase